MTATASEIRRRNQDELRMFEVADAWFDYLHSVKTARLSYPGMYDELEGFAWTGLKHRLDAIHGSRRARFH